MVWQTAARILPARNVQIKYGVRNIRINIFYGFNQSENIVKESFLPKEFSVYFAFQMFLILLY